jgi:hypothetical protein
MPGNCESQAETSECLFLEQVSRELLSLFEQQPDIGTFSILSDWILERPNVFDPGSRSKPKPRITDCSDLPTACGDRIRLLQPSVREELR